MFLFFRGWNCRKLSADSVAFLLYTVYTGWILVVYEKYLCDLAIEQVVVLRLMSGVPRTLLGFFCGVMEEAIRKRIRGDVHGFMRRAAAGTLALCFFQLPIYVASALILRAPMEQILVTCGIYIAIDIVFGWSYAVLLERMRGRFGVTLGEQL